VWLPRPSAHRVTRRTDSAIRSHRVYPHSTAARLFFRSRTGRSGRAVPWAALRCSAVYPSLISGCLRGRWLWRPRPRNGGRGGHPGQAPAPRFPFAENPYPVCPSKPGSVRGAHSGQSSRRLAPAPLETTRSCAWFSSLELSMRSVSELVGDDHAANGNLVPLATFGRTAAASGERSRGCRTRWSRREAARTVLARRPVVGQTWWCLGCGERPLRQGPIRYGRIISLSSCSRMWQCHTKSPGRSKSALTRVISLG
jgi:hypothetical protein